MERPGVFEWSHFRHLKFQACRGFMEGEQELSIRAGKLARGSGVYCTAILRRNLGTGVFNIR